MDILTLKELVRRGDPESIISIDAARIAFVRHTHTDQCDLRIEGVPEIISILHPAGAIVSTLAAGGIVTQFWEKKDSDYPAVEPILTSNCGDVESQTAY